MTAESIKVEFQGGEPLLRLDLLDAVRTWCRARFKHCEFVICSNLQRVSEAAWAFFDAADTFVSTSLDGDLTTHEKQRTHSRPLTEEFYANLRKAIERLGHGRVSALPTIDLSQPPDPFTLISSYESIGLSSIYLRPINYQGFARRSGLVEGGEEKWRVYYGQFIDALIDRNFQSESLMEEFYLTHCLRRILGAEFQRFTDLRNPQFYGGECLVVDYDGTLYPTDEARMLSRIGRIDLSIGHVRSGIESQALARLNSVPFNHFHEDCIHCPYQPYCGSDHIDDISRYGRIDIPKHMTWFCQRHLTVFDKAFAILYDAGEKTRHSLCGWLGLESWPEQLSPALP